MSNKDHPGNELLKTSQTFRLYSLVTEGDQPGTCGDIENHHNVSSIVHNLCAAKCKHHKRARWYVAGKEWKIDNVGLKIITFVFGKT